MAIALGKRKRVAEAPKSRPRPVPKAKVEESESDGEDMRAIFARAFEAKFKSLDGVAPKKKRELVKAREEEGEDDDEDDGEEDEELGGAADGQDDDEDDDDDDDDDWNGITEPEKDEIEVIEHTDIKRTPREELDRKAMKAFMSAKPPSSDPSSVAVKILPTKAKDDASAADEGTDAANLKNDLALQRLLNESHLLDSSFSSTDPSGKNRHKATDLRLLSLGSKGSILEQKNMPMSHRKGIAAKKEQNEFERRRDAKENGIILERASMGKKSAGPPEKRQRSIAGPSVGKFSGGTLRLSKSDVAGINGPRESRGGKRGGRGGRGSGGRGGRGGKR